MAVEFKPVFSSWVDKIGYDSEKRHFIVHYQNGSVTTYRNVDIQKAQLIWSAPSVGEALHRHIRGQHDFTTTKP